MIEVPPESASLNADSGSGISLRIGVDEEDAIAPVGDYGCEVNRRGGLADPAFLVRDGYRFSHRHVWR